MNDEKELWERLAGVEQSTKSAHHRLDNIEKLTQSVYSLAFEVKEMREEVCRVSKRVEAMENIPQKRWNTAVSAAITAIAGTMAGYFIRMIGL